MESPLCKGIVAVLASVQGIVHLQELERKIQYLKGDQNMATVKFNKGFWVAINKISGEIIAKSRERCELLHRLVLMGYARV